MRMLHCASYTVSADNLGRWWKRPMDISVLLHKQQ